ncbi:hypothetical protein B0T17DRAFT_618566 [Bombardia bombarda]|uniref:Patatin-like phospholipase domain-containing protein n=1 Tax=Bombardia bombarda TaxID=252184 RepID=A0AA39WM20_9PEZI|nr:hypothetical protein B0T17DRAFT_618566 [Bombardia bombarda]
MLADVVWFWRQKLQAWYHGRTPVEVWLDVLNSASVFEEWEEAALQLDNILGLDLWRNNATSRHYDYRLIHERLAIIEAARDARDVDTVVDLLRSGLVRNLGNITATKLYNRSFAGTKFLIEEYITQVAEAVEDIGALLMPQQVAAAAASTAFASTTTAAAGPELSSALVDFDDGEGNGPSRITDFGSGMGGMSISAMSTQTKLEVIHDTRRAFGRSTLVLQGGAIFGLCHLGVVKALFLRGLLPRIITGTATGALIATLVAIHTEEELLRVLSGDGIDLSAFSDRAGRKSSKGKGYNNNNNNNSNNSDEERSSSIIETLWEEWATVLRRAQRFWKEGYFLDVKVLEECVRTNVGDVTFEEAYHRSKRVLNITVATAGQGGVPTLLNHLTAPNVVSSLDRRRRLQRIHPSLYGQRETRILCKDPQGNIIPWKPANTADFRHWTHLSYSGRGSPLARIGELFNVNHFIVSQARPYLIPFLQSDMHGPSLVETRNSNKLTSLTAFLVRMVSLEMRHRLRQLDTLQLLPAGIRRFLVDEGVSGASMTLVPEVTVWDFVRLLETPTKETLEYWIQRGERSVWPAVAALRIRCAVETELDRAYQKARRFKAGGLRRKTSTMQFGAAAASAAAADSAGVVPGGDGGEWRERQWRERGEERDREERDREERDREERDREERDREERDREEREREHRAHSTGARCLPTT